MAKAPEHHSLSSIQKKDRTLRIFVYILGGIVVVLTLLIIALIVLSKPLALPLAIAALLVLIIFYLQRIRANIRKQTQEND
jgi:VIT1/CCC1 family predicted Fe2+/Mn2+ transporter